MKHYAVQGGPRPGVYSSWDEAQKVSQGHKGARCKKFDDLMAAEAYVKQGASSAAQPLAAVAGETPRSVHEPLQRRQPQPTLNTVAPLATLGRFYLEVPFAEKDAAKALGAKWDADGKKWFVPTGVCLQQFERWFPGKASSQSSQPSKKRKASVEVVSSGATPANELALYTDGACHGNQNVASMSCPAGWGVVVVDGKSTNNVGQAVAELFGPVILDAKSEHFVGAEVGSNNTGELSAVCEALLWLRDFEMDLRPSVICYDSTYAAHITTGRFNAQKNLALARRAQALYREVSTQRKLRFAHVKGHSGDKWNDIADGLANRGAVGERCVVGRWIPCSKHDAEKLAPTAEVSSVLARNRGSQLCNANAQLSAAETGQLEAATAAVPPPVKRRRLSSKGALVERQPDEDIELISVTSSQ